MNTLVVLLMTAVPSQPVPMPTSQPVPMIQSQPAPVIQSEAGPVTTDTGEGWWSRFRHRPGLFSRMRTFFGGSPAQAPYPSTYPGSVSGPGMTDGRLVPTPTEPPTTSSVPYITYGAPYPSASPAVVAPPTTVGAPNK